MVMLSATPQNLFCLKLIDGYFNSRCIISFICFCFVFKYSNVKSQLQQGLSVILIELSETVMAQF